ncbi:shikimate kinase [Aquimarina sp. 2201CG14-23]|uniref:shikimate kinase n=1 Tax=Aquimarina mycalae TaxID=3040073 RepID=UPI002477DCF4|nr:shikimate kinase [Aquimarina sp. 2201CG14-23]MDH7444296.1 shikimate kinase [Aquimarina sp. 2201CG14-23]
MNIILLGYMGCGKSSIGRDLASRLKMKCLDLDDYIEDQEKKSIKQIFADKGEIYFRKKETEYLKQLLEIRSNTIISLGGGTPCFAGNIELIKNNDKAKSVYLKTSLQELVSRLYLEKDKRPLIAHINSQEDLKDFIRKHLFERSYYYNQAEYVISTDSKTVTEIAEEIQASLF